VRNLAGDGFVVAKTDWSQPLLEPTFDLSWSLILGVIRRLVRRPQDGTLTVVYRRQADIESGS
jgi:hypothetical protein